MSRVLKRPVALADLARIWSFIADGNVRAAERWLVRLDERLRLVATQPRIGTPANETRLQ